jgi:GTP-binding protein
VVIGTNVFDWEPTLTSTAELITGPRGTDVRLDGNERPTRNARREAYFERMDAKAAARAELIREREAGLWHDDDGFAVDRTSATRDADADPDESSEID